MENNYSDSKTSAFYSIQRIDLLIIAISGSGIFASWELFKYFNCEVCCFLDLKLATLFFVATIFINLTSQFFAYYSNYLEMQIEVLKAETEQQESKINRKQKTSDLLDKLTHIFNLTSLSTVFLGLCCLANFSFTFL
jgi:hypothetical protein